MAVDIIKDVTGLDITSARAIIFCDRYRHGTFSYRCPYFILRGLCPGDNESAKKRGTGKTRKGNYLSRTTLKVMAGAFGIPELRSPDGDGTFKVNLHAPGSGRATTHESLAGTLGIPELRSPDGDRLSK